MPLTRPQLSPRAPSPRLRREGWGEGCVGRRFPQVCRVHDLLGPLVLAQPLERGVAQDAVGGDVAVPDLRDEARLGPVHALFRHSLGQRDRRVWTDDRIEASAQLDKLRGIKPGADPPGITERPDRIVIGEQQRAEPLPAALGIGKADDDELVIVEAFDLEPVGAAAGAGGLVAALRDDAFELIFAGVAVEFWTAALLMIA